MSNRDSFAIRDPIHEGILCSTEEKLLINSPLVQRLKWVAQLSMVNQVYNGATHSRFAHSLGAMQIAGEYMTHLLNTIPEREWQKHDLSMHMSTDAPNYYRDFYIQLARIAGLLHDVGHGPFSHSFDHIVYKKIFKIDDGGHDLARINLLNSPILYEYLPYGIDPEDLIELWAPDQSDWLKGEYNIKRKPIYDIIRNVVEGPLGADRIDFTRRDAYNIGMTHLGTIPTSRIIQNSKIVFIDGVPKLSYHVKIIEDIIRTLDGRLSMYSSVYLHKTSVAASLLVEKMMDLVCEPFNLVNMTRDVEQFKRLTDHKIFAMISEYTPPDENHDEYTRNVVSNVRTAQRMYENLMDRKLPKMDYEVHVQDFDTPFNEYHYVSQWYSGRDPNTFIIYKSRPISGISAEKFDKYGISFHDSHGKQYTCQQLLDQIGYTIPIIPYYIVRGYSI